MAKAVPMLNISFVAAISWLHKLPPRSTRLGTVASVVLLFVAGAAPVPTWATKDDAWLAPPSIKTLRNPVPVTDSALAAAKSVYADKCAHCHGDTGKGDGAEAAMYSPQPTNLADARRTDLMTDGELFWKITEGRRPMPGFKKQLSEEQRWQLVNLIRTLGKTTPKPAAQLPSEPSQRKGSVATRQAPKQPDRSPEIKRPVR